MTLYFFDPPPAGKIGGLDAAIQSLRAAVERSGHVVRMQTADIEAGDDAVAHFHGLWQRSYPALARKCGERGIPYVVSPHGMLEPWARNHKWWKKWPYFHLVEKRWIAGASCVLATGAPEAGRLRALFPRNRVESLPLGLTSECRPDYIAARQSLGWNADETVLLFLSRIHEKKGLDLLLGAMADLHGTWPVSTRLVIVGPEEQPGYAARCRDFASHNAARLPRVEWAGAVWGEDRWRYFQGADLFCLPTHSENFGLAILEACQVGTPVLTTTETPWADVLVEGRGFIARPELPQIREQLGRFFSQPRWTSEKRQALSQWAWSSFDWAPLAPRYISLYASLRQKIPNARQSASP
jgi:glycosyltransferase involved in cell wall biosynthesis